MALVEYSDSDSDSEAPVQPTAAPTAPGPNSKKPFQKVVNRANPGKIVVNLPQTKRQDVASADDGPPAKRAKTGGGGGAAAAAAVPLPAAAAPSAEEAKDAGPAPPPKKISLFSLDSEPEPAPAPSTTSASGAYEPLFQTEAAARAYNPYLDEAEPYANHPAPTTAPTSDKESLHTIANDLNLSAAERRELFGRGGPSNAQGAAATRVINFNTDQEYQHNEDLRASGQEQTHNPVRSIAPGKHNLRQLVNAVQNNRDALEESFAKGKSNRKDASSRYGW
ncbi:hypothetical protein VdG1_06258 [Verticillium dahliae VDG1]|nr:hypothetical protein VdG1_06258 [Verticillium dahliae VDG1]